MKNKQVVLKPRWLIATMLLAAQLTNAQLNKSTQTLEEVAFPITTKGWIDFRNDNNFDAQTLFINQKAMFGLTANDEMRTTKITNDEIGFTHVRYQQYYKGIIITGAECIAHQNGATLKTVNGAIVKGLAMGTKPAIAESIAFANAMKNVKAQVLIWNDKELATKMSELANDPSLLSEPKGELTICRKNWNADFTISNLTLAYKFHIVVLPSSQSKDVFVDAQTGLVLHENILELNCNASTGNTNWYGSQTVNVSYHGWPDLTYWLETSCVNQPTIRSRRGNPITPYNYGDVDGVFTDADGVNGYNQRSGVTTMIGITNVYAYFKNVFGRNSFNGSNGTVDAYSEITGGLWLPSAENASWNTVTHHMSFGAGATSAATDDFNAYDIVGHEFTHGVHQFSVGNNYSGEHGALDESFADIFGECAEAQKKGLVNSDWLMGADRGSYLRNMADPNNRYQPDTYLGTFWQSSSDPYDNYGVHTNSGVQNFWFYLLTVGGSGTNDLGVNYSVSGIGRTAASAIAYRNLDIYLTTASGYIDAREGSIHAANDLYGSCSNEAIQVGRAWHAVGVANYSPDYDVVVACGNIPNLTLIKGVNKIETQIGCNTTAVNGTFTNMIAVNEIRLSPGFTAQEGVQFAAILNECGYAAINKTASNNVNEEVTPLISKQIDRSLELTDVDVAPNPFSNEITIALNLKSASNVSMQLFNVVGNLVATVKDASIVPQGTFKYNYATANLSSGLYFLNITVDGQKVVKKIVKM